MKWKIRENIEKEQTTYSNDLKRSSSFEPSKYRRTHILSSLIYRLMRRRNNRPNDSPPRQTRRARRGGRAIFAGLDSLTVILGVPPSAELVVKHAGPGQRREL